MSNISQRVTRLEQRMQDRSCTTCHGAAYATVYVPAGEDEDAPAYSPTHCPECGVALWHVLKIVGISEQEMFPDQFPAEIGE